MNVKLTLAVRHNNLMAIYLSDHWKFLRIRPSEIEYQSDFSRFVVNSYIPFRLLENFENQISENHFSSNHKFYYTGIL